MNIQNNDKINFGQLVPTRQLIKAALKIHNFDDAKALSSDVETRFPGNVGYYKKVIKIADNALEKNEFFKTIVDNLKLLSKDEQEEKLSELVEQLGEKIDIYL